MNDKMAKQQPILTFDETAKQPGLINKTDLHRSLLAAFPYDHIAALGNIRYSLKTFKMESGDSKDTCPEYLHLCQQERSLMEGQMVREATRAFTRTCARLGLEANKAAKPSCSIARKTTKFSNSYDAMERAVMLLPEHMACCRNGTNVHVQQGHPKA